MRELEEKIQSEGKVYPGNILKVSGFLNHRLDVPFLMKMGKEIDNLYKGDGVNKILTIEASGIAIAVCAANFMNVPVVFAKKGMTKNIQSCVYTSKVKSFTHGQVYDVTVSSDFIDENDKVLILDDFLADGNALRGLIDICKQAKAQVVGCVAAIEKGFQHGGDKLREEGYRVDSLALIDKMDDTSVTFRK